MSHDADAIHLHHQVIPHSTDGTALDKPDHALFLIDEHLQTDTFPFLDLTLAGNVFDIKWLLAFLAALWRVHRRHPNLMLSAHPFVFPGFAE